MVLGADAGNEAPARAVLGEQECLQVVAFSELDRDAIIQDEDLIDLPRAFWPGR
jgi:hypothetical protein